MTIRGNINDSMVEIGILRSMGCTKVRITRILCYELLSTVLSALTTGIFSGIMVTLLSVSLFFVIIELPVQLDLPQNQIIFISILSLMAAILGGKFGTSVI